MRKRAVLLLLGCGMAGALVLGACSQPATTTTASVSPATTTTSQVTTTPVTTAATPATSPGPSAGKPQYGGTLSIPLLTSPIVWDPAANGQLVSAGGNEFLVNEKMVADDWSKGLTGTGQYNLNMSPQTIDTYTGGLAQSWSIPTPGTIVFQVRQGVHWALDQNSPASVLMGGREVTADDWVANFDYLMHSPHSSLKLSEPLLVASANMTKTGPWEVTVTSPPDLAMDEWLWIAYGGGFYYLLPPDVIQKYGSMQDWHNVVGTGPFMLTDFVSGSEVTYKRNPNYWGTDPTGSGKGNQLPYINELDELVIPDESTQEAALRTGKIDLMNGVTTDAAHTMMKTSPDLKYTPWYSQLPLTVAMRTDQTDLPFQNVKVRQALMEATDFNALSQQLYGGDAQMNWPVIPQVFPSETVPMNQLPQNVQTLFQYNPDGAKQLLADAGYPNGFKATMVVQDINSSVDMASAIDNMWAKVGVDLTLDPKETGVYNSIFFSRGYDQMMLRGTFTLYSTNMILSDWRGTNLNNGSYVDVNGTDPTIESAYKTIQSNLFVNFSAADEAFRNLTPYVLEQSYYIPLPSPHMYNFYWPWVENYDGQASAGTGLGEFMKYRWINQTLKKSMGH